MHGDSVESALLVNAEVDSMGGVIDGGVGMDTKASPRRAAIQKAQAELRQEYDVREERRRELEFLEKGGNPLDFKLGPAASISVQSTSFTDQIVTSEAKGSFALTASPPGDSVESSGRPGATTTGRETNTADNLLLFDTENDIVEGERNSIRPNRSTIPPSKQSSQLDGTHSAKVSEDLTIRLAVKGQAYARRNRSRTSRDGAQASTADLTPAGDGKGTSALPPSRHGSRNVKGSLSEVIIKKEHPVASLSNSKHRNLNGDVVPKNVGSGNQMDMELDAPQAPVKDIGFEKEGTLEAKSDATTSNFLKEIQVNEPNPSPNPIADADPIPNTSKIVSPEMPGETAEIPSGPDCSKKGNLVTDKEEMVNEGLNKSTVCNKNCVDSESSFMQIGDSSNYHCPTIRKNNTDLNPKEQVSVIEESPDIAVVGDKESSGTKDVRPVTGVNCIPVRQNFSGPIVKAEEETCDSRSGLKDEVELAGNVQRMESTDNSVPKAEKELGNPLVDESGSERNASYPQGRTTSTLVSSQCDKPDARFSGRGPEVAPELNSSTGSNIKMANKVHEDSVLEEARIIEAKRKRIAELSAGTFPLDSRRKSHWDFVLEEMAWLANDFMQERLWKTTVAAQVCHMVAFEGWLRFDRQNLCRMQKKVAHTLAKAINQFWHIAEVLATRDDQSSGLKDSDLALVESAMVKVGEAVESKTGEANTEMGKLEGENPVKGVQLSVQGYAVRFLKYTKSAVDHPDQAEAPPTPDRISDLGIMEWEDQLSEEILFYTVPAGAMEDYRKSVELHWSQYQKSASNMNQEELDTSMFDAVSDFGSGENAYGEYEGETEMHYLAGPFEGSKSSNFVQKKRKNSSNSFSGRSYEVGGDLSYGHYVENKLGPHPSFPMGNRPSNNSNVGSIPTRRVRTASRQRFPISTGAVGSVQFSNKTDASSGDTSSFQDDQSTVQGGSQIRKGLELESTGEFGKHLMPDCTEISMKPKKKKLKHSLHKNPLNTPNTVGFVMGKGSAYEQRWSLDSIGQHEQKDSKKRMESHAFEINGNRGIGGQHVPKKLKMTKHYPDTSAENVNPLIGSIPSPVASQVNNLVNPNKLLKMHVAQNRGRKTKGVKMTSGPLGSGSSWTQFEDQALVVIVHDMGPNWELVSDVINSTLQFKCIFRKPKDCKERHKCLMDKSAGDGANSADDSGSSQPYPSTLPGIPTGSARQLFQRLRGPMEEDTLKAHFEKIISIGQHQHSRRIQNDTQDQKQTASVHNSHVLALSQVCPNNLTGGPLTPLDLCDAASPDLPLVHQGSHNSSLGIANQGSVASVLPTSGSGSGSGSGSNPILQGSSGMALGNSLPSPSAAHNASNRFSGQRPSLPMDEQQRMHYNNMLSGRNLQHSGLSVPGSLAGGDRGVRIVPGSNGMGMIPGMNRGTPMPRPGFQGVGPPSMLNMVSSPGSMHPATAVGMPNSVNMHNGSVSGQGSSMMRPRDMMHMIRPGQNSDDQGQMMMQELQMQQVTQGNSQGLPAFSGLSSGFSNQTAPPPGETFPVQQHLQQQQQQQQSHVPSIHPQQPHHQGSNPFVLRIAKDRQVHQQQRFMHQQQQQFSPSNTVLSHGQPQSSHHPISTSLQNSSQVQQQASSLPSPNSQLPLTSSSSMNPVTSQSQSKHYHPHGLGRSHSTAGSLPSQIIKQRQRQQQQHQQNFQQTGRHLNPQRQQSQSHQQPKFIKGMGRGNTSIMNQNHSADPSSHVNGLASTPGNQAHEKGEQAMHHMMQNQGLFSGSNTIQSNNLLVPPHSTNHSLSQQKLFCRSPPSSLSKQLPQVSSHSDVMNNQGQPPSVTPGHNTLPPVDMGSGQQQQRPNIHRMLQPHNRQMNSDPHMQSMVEQQPSNSRPHIGGTNSSTNCMPVLSSDSSATQWKGTSEYNSGMTKSIKHLPGVENPSPLSSTTETEPSTPSSSGQDLIHKQFSGSTTTQSNSAGTQWQPHLQQQQCQPAQPTAPSPPQPPLPPPPPPPLLQKQQPPQQPQPQPQQQLQAGQSGLYAKLSNSGPG